MREVRCLFAKVGHSEFHIVSRRFRADACDSLASFWHGSQAQTGAFIAGISGKTVPSGVGVIVNSSGQFGTVQSSARLKNDIKAMDKASEAILALKPVSFVTKKTLILIGSRSSAPAAEQVEKVDPALIVRDEGGRL
jgi:hypothetical protein